MARIGIIAPSFFSYDKAIASTIADMGHDVTPFDDRPSNTNLSKILIRLKLHFLLKKKILDHRRFITSSILKSEIETLLVISPEIFNKFMVEEIKKENKKIKTILYLWDSINNKKNFKELLDIVDVVYSFDREDCLKHKSLNFLPLFFENAFMVEREKLDKFYDICFVGTFHSNRAKLLSVNENKNIKMFLHLYIQGPIIKLLRSFSLILNLKLFILFWRNTVLHTLSKSQIVDLFKKSKTIVDYQHPDQCGLTCRTFEALASGCKLMTTNKDIVNYEFYDEELIYVMENEEDISFNFITNKVGVETLNKMQSNIKTYSINNWVDKVLNSQL